MTVEEVVSRVKKIAEEDAGDSEAMHYKSDVLWREVLTTIAEGSDYAACLAKAALAVDELDFERWCA